MTHSITTEDVHEDDDQPATKRDLRLLKQELDGRFNELRDHFDAVLENIVAELRGANAEEISLLKDNYANHEERLTAVERTIGSR